jgi:hypothetical protein
LNYGRSRKVHHVMTLESFINSAHLILLLGIFGIIASYKPSEGTRYRPVISLLAASLAGMSLAMATHIVTRWDEACQSPQPLWATLSAVAFVAVACVRGNVAKLIPRFKRSHNK